MSMNIRSPTHYSCRKSTHKKNTIEEKGAITRLFLVNIPVTDPQEKSLILKQAAKFLDHRHGTVMTPGATDADVHGHFSGPAITTDDKLQQGEYMGKKLPAFCALQHIRGNRIVATGELPHIFLPIRVRKESHIKEHVRVFRGAVLKAEGKEQHVKLFHNTLVVHCSPDDVCPSSANLFETRCRTRGRTGRRPATRL